MTALRGIRTAPDTVAEPRVVDSAGMCAAAQGK
jgi:hypothetical protein